MNGQTRLDPLAAEDLASGLFGEVRLVGAVYLESLKGRKVLWVRLSSGRWLQVRDYSSLPPETAELLGCISIKATAEPARSPQTLGSWRR